MPFRYTNVQYCEMVRTLARCNDNVNLAVQRFQEEYGIAVSNATMLAATQRLRDYGAFRPPMLVERDVQRNPNFEEAVLDYFHNNPTASTRQAGRRFDCSHITIWRILNKDNQHPYHYRRCQELNPHDFEPRVTFCRWILENRNRNILWTDECTFTRRGLFNQHNRHMWAHENPFLVEEDNFQHRFSLNVWAGIIGPCILGPVFLPRLNGPVYLEFLRNTLPELLDDVPLRFIRGLHYQHDGAPAHFELNVRRHLTDIYQQRWIGRGAPVQWPPRSPDLTPLDFFLWARVKSLVYDDGNGPATVQELRNKITAAFETIRNTPAVLNSLNTNLRKRAVLCIRQGGRHFEQLLS